MGRGQKRKKKKRGGAGRSQVAPPLQPGSKSELEERRQNRDLRSENRALRAQLKELDPADWPPRYRTLLHRLTETLLELEEAATPLTGRILQLAGRSPAVDSMRDEGAATKAARRMQDRIVREVNAVLDGTWNPSLAGKRCRRSPNQCPMSGRVQRPLWADHVLNFCTGCGHPFPQGEVP